ncbi:unnamed protein product [Hydatigera taeniaeformis]|uniref:Ecdysone-induced protein 74EF n=1 Tax=Hydatigena taeniaeformis TaxID=6205 RepID=A0A0R3X8Y8_HYDTA|nr:unnamed protein product [Hydatigera taeniaeformis]
MECRFLHRQCGVFSNLTINFLLSKGYLSGYYAVEGCQVQHHSPYSLQHQQQQFHISVDPRQTSGEQSAAGGGGTSGGSSSLSSHHLRYQPFATCSSLQPQTHLQQQGGAVSGSAGSNGHSILTSNSPPLIGPHGYLTGSVHCLFPLFPLTNRV